MAEIHTEPRTASASLMGGAIAGIVGGILMAIFAMLYATATGMGFFGPLRMIAATLYGEGAMTAGADALLVGLIIHVVVSAFWGAIFGLLARRVTTAGAATGLGVLFAIGVLVLMTFIVVPIVNPVMHTEIPKMPVAWFIEHALFGVGLGLLPAFRRRIGHPPAPQLRPKEAGA